MPPPAVASVVAVGLMLVAIYAPRIFVAPADLSSLLFTFPSHDLTYVSNVMFFSGFDYFFFFLYDIRPGYFGPYVVWAIGLVEWPLCGCTEFA